MAQVATNKFVLTIESFKVRCLMLWKAQRWSPVRAAQYSTYYAQILDAKAAVAKDKLTEEDLDRPDPFYARMSLKTQEPIHDNTVASLIDRSAHLAVAANGLELHALALYHTWRVCCEGRRTQESKLACHHKHQQNISLPGYTTIATQAQESCAPD